MNCFRFSDALHSTKTNMTTLTNSEQILLMLQDDGDICELLEDIHYSFGVEFTVPELTGIETVGELFDLIVSKQQKPMADGCLSRTAFYRLRATLRESFGLKRSEVRPQTSLAGLMPPRTRRAQWEQFSQELRLKIPELQYPGWFRAMLAIAFLGGVGSLIRIDTPLILLWIVFWIVAVPPMIAPYKDALAVCTVGDLARYLAIHEHASLVDERGGWNRRDALNAFRHLISEHTSIPVGKIVPDMRFPKDLGY